MDSSTLRQARKIYRDRNRVCVLTGAGVSAESGVPTFRGEDGLWKNYNPMELATNEAFRRDPALVWEWYQWRRQLVRKCEPNPSHHAISKIESEKEHFLLITQNVDGLHKRAGSGKVVEIHGNIWDVKCISCESVFRRDEDFDMLPPTCNDCGSFLRPNVVWFGETIPREALETSMDALSSCDLLIVAGTSGYVQPAASFAQVAIKNRAAVIEVNIESTPNAAFVDHFFLGKSGEILPALISDQ
jgi:NAD-dependent deacetylase